MANVATGRFAFGANWSRFRFAIDGERIEQATRSFKALLGDGPFVGRTMLDVGCGSGLSSLVARRLGMHVRAFDYDSDSVACSKEVRQMFAAELPADQVEANMSYIRALLTQQNRWDLIKGAT